MHAHAHAHAHTYCIHLPMPYVAHSLLLACDVPSLVTRLPAFRCAFVSSVSVSVFLVVAQKLSLLSSVKYATRDAPIMEHTACAD